MTREEMGAHGSGMRWDIVRPGARRKHWRVEGEEKSESVLEDGSDWSCRPSV